MQPPPEHFLPTLFYPIGEGVLLYSIRLPTCRKSAQSPWLATHAGWKRIHLAHKAEHAVNLGNRRGAGGERCNRP